MSRSSSLGFLPVDNGAESSGSDSAAAESKHVPAGDGRLEKVLEAMLSRLETLEKARSAPPAASSSAAAAPRGVPMSSYLRGGAGRVLGQAARVPQQSSSSSIVLGFESEADDGDGNDEDGNEVAATNSVPLVSDPSAPRPHPLFERLAPQIISDVGRAGFKEWLRTQMAEYKWQKSRNLKECETLAEALDALVLEDDVELAKEILARRFVGVVNADQSGNWNVASVLAQNMSHRTLLRPTVLSAVLREAKNLSILENGAHKPKRSGNRGDSTDGDGTRWSGRGGGRGGRGGRGGKGNQAASISADNSAAANKGNKAATQSGAGGSGNGQ